MCFVGAKGISQGVCPCLPQTTVLGYVVVLRLSPQPKCGKKVAREGRNATSWKPIKSSPIHMSYRDFGDIYCMQIKCCDGRKYINFIFGDFVFGIQCFFAVIVFAGLKHCFISWEPNRDEIQLLRVHTKRRRVSGKSHIGSFVFIFLN